MASSAAGADDRSSAAARRRYEDETSSCLEISSKGAASEQGLGENAHHYLADFEAKKAVADFSNSGTPRNSTSLIGALREALSEHSAQQHAPDAGSGPGYFPREGAFRSTSTVGPSEGSAAGVALGGAPGGALGGVFSGAPGGSAPGGSAPGGGGGTTLTIRYSKLDPHAARRASETFSPIKMEYPYGKLHGRRVAYRGFPLEGPHSLKNRWTVQVVGAQANRPPTQPLPQFPQQELLVTKPRPQAAPGGMSGVVYVGLPGMQNLSEQQIAFNSGAAYLSKGSSGPTSTFFYASGYNENSAVAIQKPFPESVYRTVVAQGDSSVATISNYKKSAAV